MEGIAKLGLIVSVFLILSSCEKEKIVEVDIKNSWTLNDAFLYNRKIQMNSVVGDNQLHILGTNAISTLSIGENNVEHSMLFFDYPIQHKLPVASKVFVGLNATSVKFYPTKNPVLGGTNTFISLPEIDSKFAAFDLPGYEISESLVLNNQRQCLIPYLSYLNPSDENKVISGEPNFVLAELLVREGNSDFIELSGHIKVSAQNDVGPVISLHAINEFFFVTGSNKTIRISPSGQAETVFLGRLYKVFEYAELLFAFSDTDLFKSDNNGLTWQSLGEVDEDFSRINYTTFQGKLIGYFNSQVFHLTITETNLDTKEVLTDGVDGNTITSVAYFDNKVYLTTLSGVFTKPVDNFFQYIEE